MLKWQVCTGLMRQWIHKKKLKKRENIKWDVSETNKLHRGEKSLQNCLPNIVDKINKDKTLNHEARRA